MISSAARETFDRQQAEPLLRLSQSIGVTRSLMHGGFC